MDQEHLAAGSLLAAAVAWFFSSLRISSDPGHRIAVAIRLTAAMAELNRSPVSIVGGL
jgi:hypothetical protein